ncbi:MAG: heat shock protein transcriptional repressor HspR [Solirubrobacteraceae bacterium]
MRPQHAKRPAGDAQPGRRQPPTVTRIEVETDRGVFMISVAAELANMHPQTLRMYEARGLIEPQRSPKGTRLYSQADVERLRRIHEMTAELGLNLAGVERVLDLESEVQQLHDRIEELELQALQAQVKLAEEVEQVRRSFRAELVPFPNSRPPGRELVRVADVRWPFRVRPRQAPRQDGRTP